MEDKQLKEDSSQPAPSKGISFSFQKKSSQSKVKASGPADGGGLMKDYVISLEDKDIQSTIPKVKEKDYVVPFIAKNVWRTPATNKKPESGGGKSKETSTHEKTEEELQLDREAAEAVLRDVREAQLRASQGENAGDSLVVPLLLQNKPPTVEGREDDELADVELRPEQSTMEEYESMPIDRFGEAVLKGMGWKKGEAIGRTNKGLVEPIEFIPRLGGLGLGATPRAPPPDKRKRIKKPGEVERKVARPYIDKDGRVRHVKKIGEDIPEQPLQGFVAGNYARVLSGPHRDLQGKIVSVDDDTARVTLRMAINSQLMTFSQHHLELMTKDAYVSGGRGQASNSDSQSNSNVQHEKSAKKYGLITKKDRMKEREEGTGEQRSTSRHSDDLSKLMPPPKKAKHSDRHLEARQRAHDREDRYKTGREGEDSSSRHRTEEYRIQESEKKKKLEKKKVEVISREENWLSSNLRVRVVDKSMGRLYNTKVVIVDVVSPGTCVCQTDAGKLLEGVSQSMLETVIPKGQNTCVMLVGGKRKRQLGRILEQDRPKAKAVVELILTKEVIGVHFDDICEYVGDVEDMDM